MYDIWVISDVRLSERRFGLGGAGLDTIPVTLCRGICSVLG